MCSYVVSLCLMDAHELVNQMLFSTPHNLRLTSMCAQCIERERDNGNGKSVVRASVRACTVVHRFAITFYTVHQYEIVYCYPVHICARDDEAAVRVCMVQSQPTVLGCVCAHKSHARRTHISIYHVCARICAPPRLVVYCTIYCTEHARMREHSVIMCARRAPRIA